jgi:hypothetical protein
LITSKGFLKRFAPDSAIPAETRWLKYIDIDLNT